MSLDVTPGMPSSPGAGPPTPSLLAGAVAAGPPGADANALFAALLVSQGQMTSATVPTKAATASSPTLLGSSVTTSNEEPKTERDKKEAVPNDPNTATSWLPMPAPLPTQATPAPITETAYVPKKEVMDTVPAPTSPAPAGKADIPNSELLSFSPALTVPTTPAGNGETRPAVPTAIPHSATAIAVPLPVPTITVNDAPVIAKTRLAVTPSSTPSVIPAVLTQAATVGILPVNARALSVAPTVPSALTSISLPIAGPIVASISTAAPVVQATVSPIQATSLDTVSVSADSPVSALPQSPRALSQAISPVYPSPGPTVVSVTSTPAPLPSGADQTSFPAAPADTSLTQAPVQMTLAQAPANTNPTPNPALTISSDSRQALQVSQVVEIALTPVNPALAKTPLTVKSISQAVSKGAISANRSTAPVASTAPIVETIAESQAISANVDASVLPAASLPSDGKSGAQMPVPPVSAQTPLENASETANNTSSFGSTVLVSQSAVRPSLNLTVVLSPGTSVQPASKETQTASAPLAPRGQAVPENSADAQAKTSTVTNDGSVDLSSQLAASLAPTLGKDASSAGTVKPSGPVTREDRAQMMGQVSDAVGALQQRTAPGGESQMSLQLHPKEWGTMQVSVRMVPTRDAAGVPTTAIVAHVVASSPLVKTALEAHSGELQRTLQEAGLRLDRLTVTVQSATASSQSQTAAGNGQSAFSGSRGDLWQPQQSQTNGSAASGGNSSAFASFSDSRQGRSHTGQQSAAAYGTQDNGETEAFPATSQMTRASAGFDQRV